LNPKNNYHSEYTLLAFCKILLKVNKFSSYLVYKELYCKQNEEKNVNMGEGKFDIVEFFRQI
jgi:hypothetical protein